jgi:hypothetical protein
MIPFFRKIRQQLLTGNRFSKYLLYAIGEIILVVIGILIALQINNWNDIRKSRAFEREMLSQIQENLNNDKTTLERIKLNYENALISFSKILDREQEQHPDSLKFWLGDIIQFERFQPITNSYEALKSEGLDQLSDKKLGRSLGTYYDDEINRVIQSVDDIERSFHEDWRPILKESAVDFKFQEYVIVAEPSIFDTTSVARNNLVLNRDNYNGSLQTISAAIQNIEKLEQVLSANLRE